MFLADTLRTEGDVPGAIRELEKVLEQAPGNISAVRLLGLTYLVPAMSVERRRWWNRGVPRSSGTTCGV